MNRGTHMSVQNNVAQKPTVFITVRADGFMTGDEHFPILSFRLMRESKARKLWLGDGSQRRLECFSSNGSTSRYGKPCGSCGDSERCKIKLRLHFTIRDMNCCLELPGSSMENFLRFRDETEAAGENIRNVPILASVVDRGYWGEVVFRRANADSS
jgi:hypothetical protein